MLSLSNYPGQLLFVDTYGANLKRALQSISSALQNTTTLAAWLPQHMQPPSLGIVMLSDPKKVLFAIQAFHDKHDILQEALRELGSYSLTNQAAACPSLETFGLALLDECVRAGAMQTFPTATSLWTTLEVTLVSCRELNAAYYEMTKVIRKCSSKCIKKARLIHITDDDATDTLTLRDDVMEAIVDEMCGCSYDYHSVAASEQTKLEEIFKEFLIGRLMVNEDSIITLHLAGGTEGCTLKCEIQESLLNPAALPYADCLAADNWSASLAFAQSMDPDTYRRLPAVFSASRDLVGIKLIPAAAICESMKFGMPLLLKPTCCWKLDWTELTQNQQAVTALAQLLRRKGMALVVQEAHDRKQQCQMDFYCDLGTLEEKPRGFFALYPACAADLLVLRSVACRDISVQPVPASDQETLTDETIADIENILSKVPTEKVFKLWELDSGLIESLRSIQPASSPCSGRQQKAKQPPAKTRGHNQRPSKKVAETIAASWGTCSSTSNSTSNSSSPCELVSTQRRTTAGYRQKRARVMEPLAITRVSSTTCRPLHTYH